MNNNQLTLLCAIPLLTLAAHSATAAPTATKPNVIIIYADDLGYGDVSYQNKEAKFQTPNIDRLAKSGVAFSNAHTVSSVSTPSRYGLMTGEYSWKSSLKKNVLYGFDLPLIPVEKPTIATMMGRNGYQTACIGKWHLGAEWSTNDGKPAAKDGHNVQYDKPVNQNPTTRGFDYYYGVIASLDMPPYLMVENDRVLTQPTGNHLTDPNPIVVGGKIKSQFGRPGDYVDGETPETFLPRFTAKVKSKIEEYNSSEDPFFIYFALSAPHTPIAPNKEFIGKSGVGKYGDFVLEVDDVVGQVVKKLEDEGILENTIIILSSDNGPEKHAYDFYLNTGHKSSGSLKGVKRDLWEGGHRVPFIISWAGELPRGKRVDETICLSDVYETLADVVDYKTSSNEAADSYSILPLLTKNGEYEREYTVHHSCTGRFAVRYGDWVLIENGWGDDNNEVGQDSEYYKALGYTFESEKPVGELFNLKKDPQQNNSLYDQNPEIVAQLTAYLDKVTKGHNTMRDNNYAPKPKK